MILHNIDNYKLYKYITGNSPVGEVTVLRQLNRELEIGESAFLENSENKIKRISDTEYMFQRFDTISTHIENYDSNYNLNDIRNKITKKLNYNLKYVDDRAELVKNLLDENQWIYDLVSTNRSIQKEIKTKKDFRSDQQPFDKAMETISSYINRAKFKNKEDENTYNQQLEKIEIKQSEKYCDNIDTLDKLISEVQSYHHKIIKQEIKINKKIDYTKNIISYENQDSILSTEEEIHRQKKVKVNYKKGDIPNTFWDKSYYSETEKTSRKAMLQQMKNEISTLYNYIGLNIKNLDERKIHRTKLVKKINSKLSEQQLKTFNGDRQLGIIIDMYNQLKGDYEISKKILTDEIEFKRLSKGTTVYDINTDSWYSNANGDIVEISNNHILLSDKNTYKGLILNYKDLKDKYRDKMDHDIWALLFVFEELLDNTKFTQDEIFVLEMLFDNYNQKQIREKYESINLTTLNKRRISNLINNIIPTKILNTYRNNVEEWLYTYKIKGVYKVCSKCGEIKLANERYFGKHSNTKDGYQSACKKCDNLRK